MAARFAQNRHRNTSSVGEMLGQLKWPTLQQRRKDARITMLSKILDKKVEVKCKDLKPASDRARRSSVSHGNQLKELYSRTDYRKYSFFPRPIRDWNGLHSKSVASISIDHLNSS